MLGEPVGKGPQPADRRSVSHDLNALFTPMVDSLRRKAEENPQSYSCRAIRASGIVFEEVERDNGFTSKMGVLIENFPSIYGLGDKEAVAPFTLSNPMVVKAIVGKYGADWSSRLAFAGAALIKASVDPESPMNILREAEEANRDNRKLLDNYTNRHSKLDHVPFDELQGWFEAMWSGNELPKYGGSIDTVAEGLQTVVFLAALLTRQKVEGYEDPEKLLEALVDQGIFSDYSLIVPPVVTGIMGRFGGAFMPPAVVTKPDGSLSINPEIKAHFNAERNNFYVKYSTDAENPLDRRGCPLGKKLPGYDIPGVDMSAQLFMNTLKSVK